MTASQLSIPQKLATYGLLRSRRLAAARYASYTGSMGEVSGMWSDCLDCAALSDIGLRRANNQDAYAIALAADQADFDRRGHLFMVADGMGAHAAGELASKIATDVVPLSLSQAPGSTAARGPACGRSRRQPPDPRPRRGQPRLSRHGHDRHRADLAAGRGLAGPRRRQPRLSPPRPADRAVDLRPQPGLGGPGGRAVARAAVANYISKNIITRSLGPALTVQVDLEGPLAVQAGRHLPAVQRRAFGSGHRRRDRRRCSAACRPPRPCRRWSIWRTFAAGPTTSRP